LPIYTISLIIDGVTPDHTIMHVQYSNGITFGQSLSKPVVNNANVVGDKAIK